MFQIGKTYTNPGKGSGPQRGFPAPGSGQQSVGAYTPPPKQTGMTPLRPTLGTETFAAPSTSGQRGFPSPFSALMARLIPQRSVPATGHTQDKITPDYSRGAAAVVQTFGQVYSNPIGAGIVAANRPRAFYGNAGQYYNHQIFWTSQAIPTSVRLQPLNSPEVLSSILDSLQIQAVVRTT